MPEQETALRAGIGTPFQAFRECRKPGPPAPVIEPVMGIELDDDPWDR